jgi:hypothetical protein
VSEKKSKRKRSFFVAGSRDSEDFLPLKFNHVGIRGRFHICLVGRSRQNEKSRHSLTATAIKRIHT